MGAGASTTNEGGGESGCAVNNGTVVVALKGKLQVLKDEVAKEGTYDTPRGETAKAEVKRLREILKNTLEGEVNLESCLNSLEKETMKELVDSTTDDTNGRNEKEKLAIHVSGCQPGCIC